MRIADHFPGTGWDKLALHRSIQDLGWRVPCARLIVDPKILSKSEK